MNAEQIDGVLGLDVAKATVQGELRPHQGSAKVRFEFCNNPRGFSKLGAVLARQACSKVCTSGWRRPALTARP
jgi:hypothetical protein